MLGKQGVEFSGDLLVLTHAQPHVVVELVGEQPEFVQAHRLGIDHVHARHVGVGRTAPHA